MNEYKGFKIGEKIIIDYPSDEWSGIKEIIDIRLNGAVVLGATTNIRGLFYWRDIKKIKVTNWRKRIENGIS